MYYEGTVEVNSEEIAINMRSEDPKASVYDVQMNNEPDTLEKFLGIIKPEFDPDEPEEEPTSYAQKLKQQGYGTFYTSDTNINDLVNIYGNTEIKAMNAFPGLESPREKGDITFIETIHNFSGMINENIIENKTIQFRYRGEL